MASASNAKSSGNLTLLPANTNKILKKITSKLKTDGGLKSQQIT